MGKLSEETTVLHGNSQLLVTRLESIPLLDGRYSNIQLVNVGPNRKRGFFSLVFKARDEIEGKDVALKFLDLDPAKQDRYRLLCFEREHKILELLRGAARCLQLYSPYLTYDLTIEIPGQEAKISIPARYFAVDWIEDDIDDFFSQQESQDPVFKLKLFNEVVLAVESLHTRQIFHRDLKVDNFRCRTDGHEREILAIDLGTAARMESAPIATYNNGPVGFLMYSAPEAFCGMAGLRNVAPATDIFALGCMLFELFHPDDYPSAFRSKNADFDLRFSALKSRIDSRDTLEEKLSTWAIEAPRMFQGLTPVSLSAPPSSAPPAVARMISDLVAEMTEPDFRYRISSFEMIRRRCWSAIRVLENVGVAKRRAQLAANRRAAKMAKAIDKDRRRMQRAISPTVMEG